MSVFIFAAFIFSGLIIAATLFRYFAHSKLSDEKKRDEIRHEEFRPNFDPYRDQSQNRNTGDLRLRQTGTMGGAGVGVVNALPRPHNAQKSASALQPQAVPFLPPPAPPPHQQQQQQQQQTPFTQVQILEPVQIPRMMPPALVGELRVGVPPIVQRSIVPAEMPLHPAAMEVKLSPLGINAVNIKNKEMITLAREGDTVSSAVLTKQVPRINLKELSLSTMLGGGAFGQVWKGNWRGTPVAVKILSAACQSAVPEHVLKAFEDEVSMLSGLRHPNICLLMGVCFEPTNRAIVTELVSRGSLWDVLRTQGIFPAHTGPAFWPWWAIRKVFDGTCKGLAYLHSHDPPIIHRDLKSANLLLDDSFNVKICDFGLARLRDLQNTMTANVGTLQWMAPEVISGRPYSERADMYSVSMILFELLTGHYPFEGLGQIEVAVQVSQHNVRPHIPDFCPASLAQFIQQCWDIDPVKRKSATQALAIIDSILPLVL